MDENNRTTKLSKSEMKIEQKKMAPAYLLQLLLTFITSIALYFTVIGWSSFSGAGAGIYCVARSCRAYSDRECYLGRHR